MANPVTLSGIVGVATSNLAIDSGLSLLDLLKLGSRLSGNIAFYTLPIRGFGRTPGGEDINLVDLPVIHATVHHLLSPPGNNSTTPTTATATPTHPSRASAAPTFATPVPATGTNPGGAPPTALTELATSGIPCVK